MARDQLHRELLKVFADACTPRAPRPIGKHGYCPPADVFYESASDEVVVRFELPGLERDEINLFVDRRELTVRGERRFPVAEGRSYQQVELDYGTFERRIRLGVDVDPDKTTASYGHGILEVRLALAPVTSTTCQVPITSERDEGEESE